ncbi:LexA family protein [Prevotella sp.]|jgi:DNA polymerase V|uniref:LexA family protein n=1 Tax=Prevotella sp. TaxID=59823 RepID=UPI00344B6797
MNKAKDNNTSSGTGTIENIKLLKGEWLSRLSLALAPNIKAGFPSPADDYLRDSLDFNRDLIKNPEATFYGRVSGDSMRDAGINEGDIAVIDRSLQPTDGDVIVAYVNEEFTIKYLDLTHKEEGYIELRPANPDYSPIRIDSTDNFRVWGVVVWTIKQWK